MTDQKLSETANEEIEIIDAEVVIPPSREEILADSFKDLSELSEVKAASYLTSSTVPKGGE